MERKNYIPIFRSVSSGQSPPQQSFPFSFENVKCTSDNFYFGKQYTISWCSTKNRTSFVFWISSFRMSAIFFLRLSITTVSITTVSITTVSTNGSFLLISAINNAFLLRMHDSLCSVLILFHLSPPPSFSIIY